MIKDPDIVWNNCLTIIKKDINPQSYKTWFEPVKAVKFKDNILSIQVPNKFFYEWLEEHYVKELKKAITAEIGGDARLEYQILVDNHHKNLNYFKNRNKIGVITENIYELEQSIELLINNPDRLIDSIKEIKKEIVYIGKAKEKIHTEIDRILN